MTDDLIPRVRVYIDKVRYELDSSEALSFGEWAHIQGIYNGTGPGAGLTLNVYDASNNIIGTDYVAVSGTLDPSSYSLYFGVDLGNSLTSWGGGIDEVRVYVPEPATLGLLVVGGLALLRRRRK